MRAFIGIPLTDAVRSSLCAVADAMRDASPGWRGEKWVAPGNLHITLRFLGEIDAADVDGVRSALGNVARSREPYACGLLRVIARPRPRAASMLWARVTDNGDTATLAADLARVFDNDRFSTSTRAFVPHVTLVRTRSPRAIATDTLDLATAALAHAEPGGLTMSVTHTTLYRSTLTRSGPVYEVLGRFPLGQD